MNGQIFSPSDFVHFSSASPIEFGDRITLYEGAEAGGGGGTILAVLPSGEAEQLSFKGAVAGAQSLIVLRSRKSEGDRYSYEAVPADRFDILMQRIQDEITEILSPLKRE